MKKSIKQSNDFSYHAFYLTKYRKIELAASECNLSRNQLLVSIN